MSRKKAVVNVYIFVRQSNLEPSVFVQDDFDTLRQELIHIKYHGFPATYALKYDALMNPEYQKLLKEYLDENDEISAMWEISEPLCRRAGVDFHSTREETVYDDRLGSAYSLGYTPEERKKLVDAYMEDFFGVFGKYPETVGAWVMDEVTLSYAAERYGVAAGAVCRDQIGIDGFTLWGGFPTGMYYPSRKNIYIPAQTEENQLKIPVFRLLGPDPIYNFEQEIRPEKTGVYTLEPAWLAGRDPRWISWMFAGLTEEDTLGAGYAMVGQENNFLWENIEPGLEPQLRCLEELAKAGKLRIETMAETARWFTRQYTRTPPLTVQASRDWDPEMNLTALWYASSGYRVGFLGEKGHLRIRDLFLYDETYASRYLNQPIRTKGSIFDALPVLSPQLWKCRPENRPFIRLQDEHGREPEGKESYFTRSDTEAAAALTDAAGRTLAEFTMTPGQICLHSPFRLHFDFLPGYRQEKDRIILQHEGFLYSFRIAAGKWKALGADSGEILPEHEKICLDLSPGAEGPCRIREEVPDPCPVRSCRRPMPPREPAAEPDSSVFSWGTVQKVQLSCEEDCRIRYTLDGTEPGPESMLWEGPLTVTRDTVLTAGSFRPDGTCGDPVRFCYRFGLKNLKLFSDTKPDPRKVFSGSGVKDFLQIRRGNRDYMCGRWRGTLENWDITAELSRKEPVRRVILGLLYHQRAGILLPEKVKLYAGPDREHLTFRQELRTPNRLLEHETVQKDLIFELGEEIGALRIVTERYPQNPDWAQYRGDPHVFTLADCLIVQPED